jgi:putative restriction endonuclease
MQAYVGITDLDWFEFLRGQPHLEEVNFWQPSNHNIFKALKPDELFLFKLHYPHNCIVGGGFFAHSSLLPINLAWEAFGPANGTRDFSEMRRRVAKYKRLPDVLNADYTIGCIILVHP